MNAIRCNALMRVLAGTLTFSTVVCAEDATPAAGAAPATERAAAMPEQVAPAQPESAIAPKPGMGMLRGAMQGDHCQMRGAAGWARANPA